MTRQEKIREGAIVSLMEFKGFHRAPTESIIDHVFKYLANNNVVIKVDRDLPKDIDRFRGQVKRVLKQSGYEAVEPLIGVTDEK